MFVSATCIDPGKRPNASYAVHDNGGSAINGLTRVRIKYNRLFNVGANIGNYTSQVTFSRCIPIIKEGFSPLKAYMYYYFAYNRFTALRVKTGESNEKMDRTSRESRTCGIPALSSEPLSAE